MRHEYKLDDIISLLEKEEYMDILLSDADLLYGLLAYCTMDAQALADAIWENKESNVLIEHIMSLYPMSKDVVKYIVAYNESASNEDWVKMFDVEDIIVGSITEFRNNIDSMRRGMEEKQDELGEYLERYKKEIADLTEQRRALKEAEKRDSDRHRELKALEDEVRQLREEWGEDEIDKKINSLQKEKQTLEIKKRDAEKTIAGIEKEISAIKKPDSAFNKAVDALKEALSYLPEDESES